MLGVVSMPRVPACGAGHALRRNKWKSIAHHRTHSDCILTIDEPGSSSIDTAVPALRRSGAASGYSTSTYTTPSSTLVGYLRTGSVTGSPAGSPVRPSHNPRRGG